LTAPNTPKIDNLNLIIKKYHRILLSGLIFLFFAHGLLYVFNPQDIYNASSPIKLIKYVIILAFFILNVRKLNYSRLLILVLWFIGLFFFHYFSREIGLGVTPKSIALGLMGYSFPMLIIILYPSLRKFNFIPIASWVLFIASIVGYIEFIFLKGLFEKFSSAGYRVVSIFVNPNNAGILFAILSFYLLEKGIYKTKLQLIIKAIILVNSIAIIYLTGSKTALAVLALFFLIHFFRLLVKDPKNSLIIASRFLYLIVFVVLLFLGLFQEKVIDKYSAISLGGDSREMSLKTGQIRIESTIDFFDRVSDNFFYPYRSSMMYIDNVYLEMWGDFGFIILFAFVSLNIYFVMLCIQKDMLFELSLLLVMLILGLSTNFIYIWPLGYIYWFLALEIISFKKPILS